MKSLFTICSCMAFLAVDLGVALSKAPVHFEKVQVGDFRGEAVAFGDINRDGALDVVAGGWWFENQGKPLDPENWVRHTLHNEYVLGIDSQGKGYNSNDDFIHTCDVNHDGFVDVLGGSNQGHYFLNPGLDKITGLWPGRLRVPGGHNIHSGPLWDVDNDGVTEEYLFSKGDGQPVRWAKYEKGQWNTYVIDPVGSNYGAGMGDVDGDGDLDVVRPGAWFERRGSGQSELDPREENHWIRHDIALGAFPSDAIHTEGLYGKSPFHIGRNSAGITGHTAQIYVYDVDSDGLNDLIATSGHRRGVFWYKQQPDGSFTYVLIDSEVSQAHSTSFVDIDNDGDPDLIVGKRYKAHFGAYPTDVDPLSDDPVTLILYELTLGEKPYWKKHILAEGISSGTDMDVADIDGDGDLDLVVTAKNTEGPWVLVNQLVDQKTETPKREVLFGGTAKDLEENWTQVGGQWTPLEGAIQIRNPNTQEWGHLFSKKAFVNFSLRFKYKTIHGNSGVYLRAQEGGDYGARGIQIDFGEGREGIVTDGSVMTVTKNRWKWLPGHPMRGKYPVGKWHSMAIEVVGQSYRVYVDGQITVEQKDVSHTLMPLQGKIAFQAHRGDNGEAYIKDIEVWTPAHGTGRVFTGETKGAELFFRRPNSSDPFFARPAPH